MVSLSRKGMEIAIIRAENLASGTKYSEKYITNLSLEILPVRICSYRCVDVTMN